MKTSLGDDCVAINLDYDAVKEVVQIVSDCPNDYESARLRTRERHENFTLRFTGEFSPTHRYFVTRISWVFPSFRGPAALPHCHSPVLSTKQVNMPSLSVMETSRVR